MSALTKNIIISSVGTIICIVISVWMIRPLIDQIGNLHSTLVAKKTEMVNLDQQIRAYQTAEADLKKATEKDKILNAVLEKEDLVTAVKGVEAAAARTNVDEIMTIHDPFIQTVKQVGSKAVPPLTRGLNNIVEVPYDLSVNGTYLSMIDFFSYLENLPNLTEVSKFDMIAEISKSAQGIHTGKVNTNITGVFYVKKDPAIKDSSTNTSNATTKTQDQ